MNAVAPQKGRFRTFLLVSLKHFLSDARDAAHAIKRGSGRPLFSLDEEEAEMRFAHELTTNETPEVLFDRRWLLAVLESSLKKLEAEHKSVGQLGRFEQLRDFLQNPCDDKGYTEAARRLAMTPAAVSVAVHRLRQRYRDLVRMEIAETVTSEQELADELRHLFGRGNG
jgi:DNA-directed RNA polymerase specialized sigma24 family protein